MPCFHIKAVKGPSDRCLDSVPLSQGREGLVCQEDRDGALLSAPHVLAMSATPIPRTLALAVHGDMALSQINSLPPGRTPVATRVFDSTDEGRALAYQVRRLEASAAVEVRGSEGLPGACHSQKLLAGGYAFIVFFMETAWWRHQDSSAGFSPQTSTSHCRYSGRC